MSRSTKAAKGFATSLLQSLSQILVQILLAPVVLKMAGREALGAYAAISQAVAMLTLVDVVGSWSLERFLGRATGMEDDKRFRDIFSTARTAYLVINTIFALGVVAMSFFIGRLFHLSPHIESQARYALWVIGAWAIIRTPLAAYRSASIATQDLAAVNVMTAGINIARGVASLVFVLAGTGLFGLMISGTVVEGIGSVFYRVRFVRKNPNLAPGWGIPDKAVFREMLSFGGYVMLVNAGDRLFFRSANMLAALTSGSVAASSFYTTQAPAMTGFTILQRFPDNTAPAVYELTGRGEHERLKAAFLRLTRLISLLTLPLAVGVVLFNRDVVICWVGELQYGGDLLTYTLALFIVLNGVRGICVLFAFAQGWMRLLAGTAIFQGVANFAFGYWLGKELGLGGITLALCLASLPQLFLLLRKIEEVYSARITAHFAEMLMRLVIPLGAATAAGELVHFRIKVAEHHVFGVMLECTAFLAVYCLAAYPLALHREDRADVRRYAGSILRRGTQLARPTKVA
jgi:O-antigen/teichoic acid export membrane protein